jgi:tyrosyl-tRNA synthetase
MTTPLLEGLDGVEKMSKSLGNYVGVTDSPSEMFGKLMSISDDLMWKYYTLLTDFGPGEIQRRRDDVSAGTLHPKQAKIDLATRIVADFHGPDAAARAADEFDRRFAKRELDRATLETLEWNLPAETRPFRQVLIQLKLASSGSEADQKLKQGAVRIDGRKVEPLEPQQELLERGREYTLEVGRRAYRLRVI